ncbi:ABC transporter substrate-binding protein [Reyranella sp.]|uniref:ABC transporter substrate-binding protein n=1 Tax=Reyranella sp. TaxID=1929291 RepID=UPI003BA8B786
MRRRVFLNGLLLTPVGDALAADPAPTLRETPMFAGQVAAGSLPPVARRIPLQPLVVRSFAGEDGPGRPGGDLTMLVTGARDTALMTIYSYTRLIVHDASFALRPDILESYDAREGRIFTFRLRAGHRWSDGHPFTTEDFRFYWEHMALDAELSPFGPPDELLVEGRPPTVEIADDRTITYRWDRPNPYFIESQARPAPLFLYAPAHYLKKFHPRFGAAGGSTEGPRPGAPGRSWAAAFQRAASMFTDDNPDLPTLNPWVLTTAPPTERFVFERNPYFHRIDAIGQQLPYADRVVFAVTAPRLIPARAGLGEAGLQARYLRLGDYGFLQTSARRSGVTVRLWEFGSGSQLALYPNLNASDATWRGLLRDVRLRRALSIGIDREEINQVVFLGLATPSNNTVMPRSTLFRPEYATRWANHDPGAAGRLLDELGLDRRAGDGIRLLPDGRPAIIVVENQGEGTEEADVLKLIADQWRRIGLRMIVKPQTFENFWLRLSSGEAMMTAYGGLFTAVPGPDSSPREFAPTSQGGLQWPKWGMYVASRGKQGEPCDLPAARGLLDDLRDWERAADEAGRRNAWRRILETTAEQVFTIGTVNGSRQPVVVGPGVRNVPRDGFYAWNPGGYFGLYRPETFWLAP